MPQPCPRADLPDRRRAAPGPASVRPARRREGGVAVARRTAPAQGQPSGGGQVHRAGVVADREAARAASAARSASAGPPGKVERGGARRHGSSRPAGASACAPITTGAYPRPASRAASAPKRSAGQRLRGRCGAAPGTSRAQRSGERADRRAGEPGQVRRRGTRRCRPSPAARAAARACASESRAGIGVRMRAAGCDAGPARPAGQAEIARRSAPRSAGHRRSRTRAACATAAQARRSPTRPGGDRPARGRTTARAAASSANGARGQQRDLARRDDAPGSPRTGRRTARNRPARRAG